ncbi:nicotinic acid mononucleotide adenylyltransferase [Pantoea cypripedii]|nr:nicotinic acid mononucleotide adenylyltransferase [Pantoea cypripedii]
MIFCNFFDPVDQRHRFMLSTFRVHIPPKTLWINPVRLRHDGAGKEAVIY